MQPIYKFEFPPMPPEKPTMPAEPVVPRTEPIDYEPWKAIVLAGGKYASEELLRTLYAEFWDAAACAIYLHNSGLYSKPKESRRVVLDDAFVDLRMAQAMWKECTRLITRNLEPSAAVKVRDWQRQAAKVMGLD